MSKAITDAIATAAVQRLASTAHELNFRGAQATDYIQKCLQGEMPNLQALSLLAHDLSDQLDPAKIKAQLEAEKTAAAKGEALAKSVGQTHVGRVSSVADGLMKADAEKVARGQNLNPTFGAPRRVTF